MFLPQADPTLASNPLYQSSDTDDSNAYGASAWFPSPGKAPALTANPMYQPGGAPGFYDSADGSIAAMATYAVPGMDPLAQSSLDSLALNPGYSSYDVTLSQNPAKSSPR
jgi:hypothetical protein